MFTLDSIQKIVSPHPHASTSFSEVDEKVKDCRKSLLDQSFKEQRYCFQQLEPLESKQEFLFECTNNEIIAIVDQLRAEKYEKIFDDIVDIYQNYLPEEIDLQDIIRGIIDENDSALSELSQGKNKRAIILALEIFCLLAKECGAKSSKAKLIKNYVIHLLNKLPLRADCFEANPKYLKIAQCFSRQLEIPPPFSKECALALKLQAACDLTEGDSLTSSELMVIRILGNILFVCQNSIDSAVNCIQENNSLFKNNERFLLESQKILKDIKFHIQNEVAIHKIAHIQNYEEALLQKITLTMAKHLVLPTGGINFGLIDDLKKLLEFPEIQLTEAAKVICHQLNHLKNEQMLAEFEQIELPKQFSVPEELIRITLGLKAYAPITKDHVRQVVVSALIRNFRQARAGTCFVTADIIRNSLSQPFYCLGDYLDLLRDGYLERLVFNNPQVFPFQMTTTKEKLSTSLLIDAEGFLVHIKHYDHSLKEQAKALPLENTVALWAIPGIQAICQSLNKNTFREFVKEVIRELGKFSFTIDEWILAASKLAFDQQNLISLRSKPVYSLEHLINKARYAFASQTQHLLHRAYEQVRASMVDYLASPYVFPLWTCEVFKKVITKDKNPSSLMNKLIQALYMPLAFRMKYLYNPFLEQTKKFLPENHGINEESDFGYQLWDAQLPLDFEYDKNFYQEMNNDTSFYTSYNFLDYLPSSEWKCIDTPLKFQNFLVEVIQSSLSFIPIKSEQEKTSFQKAADELCKKILAPSFPNDMTLNYFDELSHKRELKKNEFTVSTTPWSLRWGGDPGHAQAVNHNLAKLPIKDLHYAGSPQAVLAYQINYLRKQNPDIQKNYDKISSQRLICSPVHAFLLKPNEDSFRKACLSSLSANNYIEQFVKKPGLEISLLPLNIPAREVIVEEILTNQWYRRGDEKHDYERQELRTTEYFDEKIQSYSFTHHNYEDVKNILCQILIEARKKDEKIAQSNRHWEKQLKAIFNRKLKTLFPHQNLFQNISKKDLQLLLDFARNRTDSIAISSQEAALMREQVANYPDQLTLQAFRKQFVKDLVSIRTLTLGYQDAEWKHKMEAIVDNTLFEHLPRKDQLKLKHSIIITSDSNWVEGIHHIFLGFAVNPGTGEIELCRYNKDQHKIKFINQTDWFPKGKKEARWHFPDNYRVVGDEPFFNFKKFTELA